MAFAFDHMLYKKLRVVCLLPTFLLAACEAGEWESDEIRVDAPEIAAATSGSSLEPSAELNFEPPITDGIGEFASSAKLASAFPACSSTAVDPDGDGWGFENGQSCQVGLTYPVCSVKAVSDGEGWGWENEESCRYES